METINHFGNVYDGITNDKDIIDSGRRGAWFVDILKSSADTAPKGLKSYQNSYKNINYTGEATTPIRAAIVIGSDASMDKFSVADFFHDMSVGVQFRSTAQMQTFVLDKSEFYNVAEPYQFQAGATYKPANFVLGDNPGLKTKARGKVTFEASQTSITVPHGLFGASASNLWVQISSSELELFRVAGPLSSSFDIRRTVAATTPTVYWEAEVLP
ncbi:hypothetical protein HMPREF0016_00844 [Acinetobacter johnsonii SH046]|uniref:Uncharacterized protein n=1 Tax=Acinetobacter johnsonii SH046 TaxID=575586 RepID=D0S8N9_ACIJO|nr:hypothetical protein HMPREF0016_00844 [Acinetobacter johnsonii SH046]